MCAAHPEDWFADIDAATELKANPERFQPVIERIAVAVAAADPANPLVEGVVRVAQAHIRIAIDLLLEAGDSIAGTYSRRSTAGIFISYSYRAEDRRFARETGR